MKPTIYVTRPIPRQVERAARQLFHVDLDHVARERDRSRLLERSQQADAIVVCPSDDLTGGVIDCLPDRIRMIATYSSGYDHIDLDSARRKSIMVTNVPAVSACATAETAMLLALNVSRRVSEAQSLLKSGRWQGWEPTQFVAPGLFGRRLGIVGMGSIGRACAGLARGFGMEVHYHNRSRLPEYLEEGAVYHTRLADLLALTDVLSLHCPLTDATRDLIDARALAQLPRGALVVNTARGEIVDEQALLDALDSGHISGAGLDVFRGEPRVRDDLVKHPKVFALPHLGSATEQTRVRMGLRVVHNLEAAFLGKAPPDRLV